ncbi:MAG TPA: hypothetical protein VFG65_02250 [Fimbriimonadales bacterium]|nr:hypothetical protein [Fimbriimonadales bacterium]
MLRAYIGREWERMEAIQEASARRELNDYLDPSIPDSGPPPTPRAQVVDQKIGWAYSVLGLAQNASLVDVKAAYSRLSERSLPTNFPEGSDERKKAARIHLMVQEAYDVLLPTLDARLKRFQSLDID